MNTTLNGANVIFNLLRCFPVADSDERNKDLQPFAVVNEAGASLQGKPRMTLGAPSLLNDYCKKEHVEHECVVCRAE